MIKTIYLPSLGFLTGTLGLLVRSMTGCEGDISFCFYANLAYVLNDLAD
jgi:hypothetical protein